MKVLHVNNQARFQGGVERILYDMAVSLGTSGEQGMLFTLGGSTPEFDAPFAWHGMCFEEALEDFRPDIAIIHKVDDAALIARISARLPTQVFVHDHDLTCPRRHKYVPGSDLACTRKAGVGCLTHLCFVERAPVDNLIPVTLFEGVRRQRRQLDAARQADGMIVASTAMRDELVMNGIPADRIRILPPIPRSADGIQRQDVTPGRRLLFVGQVIRGKGVDLLLRALAELPEDVTLTVVGDGSHLSACKDLARSLQIDHRVRFTGWVNHDALDAYYEQSQLLVVPSRWPEPFGMVGVEAMARGRPVVAFNTGGISEWLQDGETGLLAAPGDPADMARKVLSLIENPARCERMGRLAGERVRQEFTHDGFINALSQHLRNQLNEHSDLGLRHG